MSEVGTGTTVTVYLPATTNGTGEETRPWLDVIGE